MADSKDNEEGSSENFADDLDAMLNDVASKDEQDELIDDEDAIDRLLMDDAFGVDAEDENEEGFSGDEQVDLNLDESASNKMAEKQQESDLDEFGIDDIIDSVSTEQKKEEVDEFADDEFDVDSLLNSVAEEANAEKTDVPEADVVESISESSPQDDEDDEFDIDDLIDSTSSGMKAEAEVKTDDSDDDFLMADFDISADDDDELLESNDNEEGKFDSIEDEGDSIVQDVADEQTEDTSNYKVENNEILSLKKDLDTYRETSSKTTQDLTQVNEVIEQLNKKISQILIDNAKLEETISELTSTGTEKTESVVEEIDTIQKEQRKLKKLMKEGESRVPVITYVVMSIAILALLVGAGLGAVGYGAQTNVDNLTELVATLEEEIEIITAKDSTADIRDINFQLNELKINDDGINQQLEDVTNKIQQPNPLKAVVDDLIEQNDHSQKAIEQLLASVETLENRPAVVASKVKYKKAKKIIPKVEWAVNLVSFKQEWYAKRKAEEFKKKGIPAKVEKVKVNGEKWFRLRVKGFKSKYEAAAYAVKIKKTLNLSSVWVTKG